MKKNPVARPKKVTLIRKKYLHLFRGISGAEFKIASPGILKSNRKTWESILNHRAGGDFSYPIDFDKALLELQKNLRFEYQYFSDSRSIAKSYAKDGSGLWVELKVPLADIIKYFDIEFQNFSQRKKKFELVYRVSARFLRQHEKAWKMKIMRGK